MLLSLLLPMALAGQAQSGPSVRPKSRDVITPAEAVIAAADVAPASVAGVFELKVRAGGRAQGRIFLNSERDYRDQRNLSIAIYPATFNALRNRFGGWPNKVLIGKTIRVRGTARRVRIDFTDDKHRPTGKYYYQTHVIVRRADQITLVGDSGNKD